MPDDGDNGWDASAAAWIKDQGEMGDFGRRFVLDRPMIARVKASGARSALDVGCGEGRFCRMMKEIGLDTTGLDPTRALLDAAKTRDPAGVYVEGIGEALPFSDQSFDLVVSYLTLIDMPDIRLAIPEMSRVLKPGGTLLVANLTPFNTSADETRWHKNGLGQITHFGIDRYLEERFTWEEWKGIRIKNYHRPLSVYMQQFLSQGLRLTHFDEPAPIETAPSERAAHYRRVPYFFIMEWRKQK
jgi:ubiquinone/menaquinone biosynthesis C-methylase UbiE